MIEWISDDGRARVLAQGSHLRARVPGVVAAQRETADRELLLYPREAPNLAEGHTAWIGKSWAGDDLEVIVAVLVPDRDQVLIVHSISRPWASGGPGDPRSGDREYRCTRVLADRRAS